MRGNRIVDTLELADTTKTQTKRSKTLFKSARKIYVLGWRKGSERLHVDKKMLDYAFCAEVSRFFVKSVVQVSGTQENFCLSIV